MTFNEIVEELRATPRDIARYWLYEADYGKERREWLINYLMAHPEGIQVNKRYCIKTYLDKDVKKLLKSGIVYTKRELSWLSGRCCITRLLYKGV